MAVCINCSILLHSKMQLYEYWAVELSHELVLIAEQWCGREVSTYVLFYEHMVQHSFLNEPTCIICYLK